MGGRIEVIESRFGPAADLQQVARVGEFASDLDILAAGAVQEIGRRRSGIGAGGCAVTAEAQSDAQLAGRVALGVTQTGHQLFAIVDYVH